MKYLSLFLLIFLVGCSEKKSSSVIKVDKEYGLTSNTLSLDFGSIEYKQSKLKTLAFLNDTGAIIPSIAVSLNEANSNYYSITYNNCNQPLAPEDKCVVKVLLNNTSSEGLLMNADLLVNDLTISFQAQGVSVLADLSFEQSSTPISTLDFGVVNNKPVLKTVFLKNKSKIPEPIGNVEIDTANFSLAYNDCSSKDLAPNQVCRLMILVDPRNKSDQVYNGSLSVNDKELPMVVSVSGGSISNPTYDLAFLESNSQVSSVSFGNNVTKTFKAISVKNIGNSLVTGLSASVNHPAFQMYYSSCNGPLAPNKSCTIKLVYDPATTTSGIFNGQLSVGSNSLNLVAEKRPVIQSASLLGPIPRLHNSLYHTRVKLGEEVTPQISASFYNESLIHKYSLANDCSNSVELPALNLSENINTVYVQVEDSLGTKSDCVLVGQLVYDTQAPSVSFSPSSNTELNEVGATTNTSLSYQIAELIKDDKHSVKVYSQSSCSGAELSVTLDIPSSASVQNVILNNLPIRNYRSVKVEVSDLAGNTASFCSPSITYGHPSSVSVDFIAENKVYAQAKKFTASVTDSFNNSLSGISITIDSEDEQKTYVSNAQGQVEFYVSGDVNFNTATNQGVKIKYKQFPQVEVYATDYPAITQQGDFKVLRRSCQELAVLDGINTDGLYILDGDENGVNPQYETYCDFDGTDGWSLISKIVKSSGTTASMQWNGDDPLWRDNNLLNSSSYSLASEVNAKFPAYLYEPVRELKVLDNSGKMTLADKVATYGYHFHSFANLLTQVPTNKPPQAVNNSIFTKTFVSPNMWTYDNINNQWGVPEGVANGMNTVPGYYIFNLNSPNYSFNSGYGQAILGFFSIGSSSGNGITAAMGGLGYKMVNGSARYGSTTTVANFNSLWVRGATYSLPYSCSNSLLRNPALTNAGEVQVNIDRDGDDYGVSPALETCEFNANGSYVKVNSWDNTASVVQRSQSSLATSAYNNNLFVKASFPGVNPTSAGYSPAMGNPAGLDIVGIYSMNNPTQNLISGGVRIYVYNSASNGAFTAGGRGYLFFVQTPNYFKNIWINQFPSIFGPADNNLNGVLDGGENGNGGQIILFANGRAVWMTTMSNGSGSDPSSYIYVRDLLNETYWIKD